MRRITLITVILAALAATASAAADPVSVQPLRDAGYAVGLASDLGNGCTTWAVSGHGLSTYVNDCDPDAAGTIGSLTNPVRIYEADWQLNHPDQAQAAQTIGQHCYSISRTAPITDQWRIVGAATDVTVSGDQLPALVSSLPDLRQSDGTCPSGTTIAVTTSTSGATNSDGSPVVTAPGAPTVVAAIQTQAQALAAAAAAAAAPTPPATTVAVVAVGTVAAPVDPANYTIVTAPADVAAETGIVAWVNTPYMGAMITADDLPPPTG